ncbi:MAG: NADH-quinone oxidoreductase subunit NuoE [Spirochaetes bacterium]|nr:NADH-quinone oxidoreductase subunit NuoE [Spirochaetota bacterium]
MLDDIIRGCPHSRDYLISILQAVQDRYGYLSRESIYRISDYLDLPESKIYGVATFYNQFRLKPPGKFQIHVCRGTACHVKGSAGILDTIGRELGIEVGGTSKDGLFSLDTVACLGACSIAPVITINGKFYGRLDNKKVQSLVKKLKRQGDGT